MHNSTVNRALEGLWSTRADLTMTQACDYEGGSTGRLTAYGRHLGGEIQQRRPAGRCERHQIQGVSSEDERQALNDK